MKTAILLVVLGLVVADATVIHFRKGEERSTGFMERSIPCPIGAQCFSNNCGGVLSSSGHAMCCCGSGAHMTVHGDLNLGSPDWWLVPCTCSYQQ
ncbi:Hypp4112 [Branchiostoma lanceolatum]|uniref:Hypp4112 protein n=1 Tax=Branchiostoma lanceolatum TaxID=7740 RepID=A0A8K0F099_BRALA|nr:Hypp4112 [Branchiostoma lanceolatum]